MANLVDLKSVCEPKTQKGFPFSDRRYRQLAQEGTVPAVQDGKIDFVEAAFAITRYYKKLSEASGVLSLQEERTRLTKIKADTAQKEYEEICGSLVQAEAAKSWLRAIVAEAKLALIALPRRLSETLANVSDPKEVEHTLRTEIYAILDRLSRPGKAKRAKK